MMMEHKKVFTLVAGPCSAESRMQVVSTALALTEQNLYPTFSALGYDLHLIYRAGIWKPRTSPNSFQGAGIEALAWMNQAGKMASLPLSTEVATAQHVDFALRARFEYVWIGARSSANPFVVQQIADALLSHPNKSMLKGIFIKNPVNDDYKLWLGNIERLKRTGIPVMAIHRGCGHQPCWSMAHQLRIERPDIPLLLDPSHLSGDATRIPALLQQALDLQFDGAMLEVHPTPIQALSDSQQQITAEQLHTMIRTLSSRQTSLDTELLWWRAEMEEVDHRLWCEIAQRMHISRKIGEWKKQHHMPALQPTRYNQILAQRTAWGERHHLSAETVRTIMDAIHEESLKQQH